MSSGFSKSDLDSFFEEPGVGVVARIVFAEDDIRTINVIFTEEGQEVDVFSNTRVATDKPSFLAKSTDVADITERMQVTFPNLESHEDGYGETYQTTSDIISGESPQTTRVYLKKLS